MVENQKKILQDVLIKCRRAFFFALVFSFFISIFTLIVSIYSMQVLDRVLSSANLHTLFFLTLITVICLVFMGVLMAIRAIIFTHVANWLDKRISPILIDNSIDDQAKNKSLISQNLRHLNHIKSFISGNNLAVLFDAPFAIIYLIVIFFIHPINGLITVIGALILLKLALINEKITNKLIKKSSDLQNEVGRKFSVISSNSESVKAMGMKSNVIFDWQNVNEKLRKTSSRLLVKSGKMTSIIKTVRMAIQVVTMASSAILVLQNKMSTGGIIATSILSGKALAPFDAAVGLWKSFVIASSSYAELNKSLRIDQIEKKKINLPEIKGDIAVDKLIYKFDKSDRIFLKSLSFKLEAGKSLAIIGPSGSGKTSLARILTGILNPSSGNVRIDSADLFDQNSEELGKFIGYLPQNIDLFNASIKENIARMNFNAKDEDVIKAAKFCGIHELILGFPAGYETVIANGASNLSGGQKQLIALARAFFGNVKFVVLDEPNSNLDSVGEQFLLDAIKKAKEKDITLVIVTHKPSIASVCDKVMILKDGSLVAFDDSEKIIKDLGQ